MLPLRSGKIEPPGSQGETGHDLRLSTVEFMEISVGSVISEVNTTGKAGRVAG